MSTCLPFLAADPACGSGNFLYIALERLLTLEKEVMTYRANAGLPMGIPSIRPHQVMGLEINEYAHEQAQVAIVALNSQVHLKRFVGD